MRHCGNCGKTGHYRSTCKGADRPILGLEGLDTANKIKIDYTSPQGQHIEIVDVSNLNLPDYQGTLKHFDPIKYPNLSAATERGNALLQQDKDNWQKVIDLKAEGKDGSADRLIRKIFGIQEPMSEEAKEKLRLWNLEHKEEIAERAKQKREFERRTKELLEQSSRKLDKKRNR